MSSAAEPKSPEEDSENAYSVEEDDESDIDDFARVKPNLIKTPSILNAIIDQIHPDIIAKSHQSNFVLFPPKLEGCTVVDLGCGVGRDVFILSKLVGENGRVIGIDSEKEQVCFYSIRFYLFTKKVLVKFRSGSY
jgi:ubiquinone/menaquinone biosynthesis C-methylase UbiE